jgi:hypothetical protein
LALVKKVSILRSGSSAAGIGSCAKLTEALADKEGVGRTAALAG